MSSQKSTNNDDEQLPQHLNDPSAGDIGMNTLYVQCMGPSSAPNGPLPVFDLEQDGEGEEARKSCSKLDFSFVHYKTSCLNNISCQLNASCLSSFKRETIEREDDRLHLQNNVG